MKSLKRDPPPILMIPQYPVYNVEIFIKLLMHEVICLPAWYWFSLYLSIDLKKIDKIMNKCHQEWVKHLQGHFIFFFNISTHVLLTVFTNDSVVLHKKNYNGMLCDGFIRILWLNILCIWYTCNQQFQGYVILWKIALPLKLL